MKRAIPLTNSDQCLWVDAADYEFLSQRPWRLAKNGYAITGIRKADNLPKGGVLYAHRVLMGLDYGDKRVVDFKDHDPLNLQRDNLRVWTKRQSVANRRKGTQRTFTSQYKGVIYYAETDRYRAAISTYKNVIYIGSYTSETEAALAYDIAAVRIFGEYALPNFPHLFHQFREVAQ